jgi:hypothetical protein
MLFADGFWKTDDIDVAISRAQGMGAGIWSRHVQATAAGQSAAEGCTV